MVIAVLRVVLAGQSERQLIMVVDYLEHDGARLADGPVTRRPLRQLSGLAEVGEPGAAATARYEALHPRPLRADGRRLRSATGPQRRERVRELAFRLRRNREPGVAGAACHGAR
jgi:hypothetical protein